MGEQYQTMEVEARAVSGWIALLCVLALLAFGGSYVFAGLTPRAPPLMGVGLGLLALGCSACAASSRCSRTKPPSWCSSAPTPGPRATAASTGPIPSTCGCGMSLRAHNLTTPTLKVNDGRGSPIEIGAVVVWRVQDTARAAFEVENYAEYVRLQCESALRDVASRHAYDHADETLLGGARAHPAQRRRSHLRDAARVDPESRRGGRHQRSTRRASPTSPMRPRSPRSCCGGSRPRP